MASIGLGRWLNNGEPIGIQRQFEPLRTELDGILGDAGEALMPRNSNALHRARMEAVRRMVESVAVIRREGGLPYTSGVGSRMMSRGELADLGFERFSDFLEYARREGIIEGTIDHGPGKREIVLSEQALQLVPESLRRPPAGGDARSERGGLIKPQAERFVPLRRDLWGAFSYFGSVAREFFYDRVEDRVVAFSPSPRPFEADDEARARNLVQASPDASRFVEIHPISRQQQLGWLQQWRPASRGSRLQLDALLREDDPFESFLDFIRDPEGSDLRWEWNIYRSQHIIEAAEKWRREHGIAADISAISEYEGGSAEPEPDGLRRALHALVDALDDEALNRFAESLTEPGRETWR